MCLRYSNSFVVVVQSLNHVWLCTSMDCSTPGLLIPHCLSEFAQTHVHQASDAIQPAYSLSPSSPFAFNLFQHQVFPMNWLFTSGGQSIGALASSSVLPMNIQDWFPLGRTGLCNSLGLTLLKSSHQFKLRSSITFGQKGFELWGICWETCSDGLSMKRASVRHTFPCI